jgi:predicted kinase
MQDEAFNQRFALLYKKTQLPVLETLQSRKFLITFSGVPASGKTTLAKRLASDLLAHRISNDEIRELIESHGVSLEGIVIGQISRRVIEEILRSSANKTVVVDSSIDRTWPAFFETAEKAGAKPFVIRMNASREKIERRLEARGKSSEYRLRHKVFFEQFNNCRQAVMADLELEPGYDYNEVLAKVKERLASLK